MKQKQVWGQLAPGPVTVKETNFLGVAKNALTPQGILE